MAVPPEGISRANLAPLQLHVPEPKFRPGDAVDFASVEVPPAGAQRRPDTAAPADSFHELAYTLVRVLDDEGRAVGPWDPGSRPIASAACCATWCCSAPLTSACSVPSVRARPAST
ncbi:hypothetical protein GCM10020258_12950 [Sphingomonas yabuuchiae]